MLITLDPFNPHQAFPSVTSALKEPNGLLAIGGCLSLPRLENAYRHGIFPWFSDNDPLLWWSPNPRLILRPEQLKISRSLRKSFNKGGFRFSHDRAFAAVIESCSAPREHSFDTWISADMKTAYVALHRNGLAHSFETWLNGVLVGGLYGVSIGRVFFGESMFHTVTDASKVALVYACRCLHEWGYTLIDCQVHTPHLASLGAQSISRQAFIALLETATRESVASDAWQTRAEADQAFP